MYFYVTLSLPFSLFYFFLFLFFFFYLDQLTFLNEYKNINTFLFLFPLSFSLRLFGLGESNGSFRGCFNCINCSFFFSLSFSFFRCLSPLLFLYFFSFCSPHIRIHLHINTQKVTGRALLIGEYDASLLAGAIISPAINWSIKDAMKNVFFIFYFLFSSLLFSSLLFSSLLFSSLI